MSNLREVETPRRQVAKILADFYGEVASAVDKPAPRFSFGRAIAEMSTEHGLRDGYECEVLGSSALIAGEPHDRHRARIPWSAFGQRAVLTVANDSAAGFLRAVENQPAIDVLRPWSVTVNAGLTVADNLVGNQTVPVETVAVAGQWLSTETSAITAEQPTISQGALVPRTFGGIIQVSRLLLLQAPNVEQFLRNQLLRIAGRAIDKAVLVGTGAEMPLGILNQSSITSQGGTSFAWSDATAMLKALADAGLDDRNVAFIAGTGARKTLQERVVVSSGKETFIWNDEDRIVNRPAYCTSDMSSAVLLGGDFSKAILGLWGSGISIATNPYDPTLFQQGVVKIRVMVSCDLCVPQIGAFVRTGTIT